MGNRGNMMIFFSGALYIGLGLSIVCNYETIMGDDFSRLIIINVLNGITVSSMFYALSDFIDQVVVEKQRNKNISKINVETILCELDLYKEISKATSEPCQFKRWQVISSNISYWLFCLAFPVGLGVMFKEMYEIYAISEGLTFIAFGLVIAAYGWREVVTKERTQAVIMLERDFHRFQLEQLKKNHNVTASSIINHYNVQVIRTNPDE